MADERRRRLERAAAAGGLEPRARLLRERLRQGDLDAERLRLAAYLGDPAARRALEGEDPPLEEDLDRWLTGLLDWSEEVRARLALLAVEERWVPAAADPRPTALLHQIDAAARAFLHDGSRLQVDLRCGRPPVLRPVPPGPSREAVRWALDLARSVRGARLREDVRAALLPWVLGGVG